MGKLEALLGVWSSRDLMNWKEAGSARLVLMDAESLVGAAQDCPSPRLVPLGVDWNSGTTLGSRTARTLFKCTNITA